MNKSFFPDGNFLDVTFFFGSRVGCAHGITPMSNTNWAVYKDSESESEVSCQIVCLEETSGPRWSLKATISLSIGDKSTDLTAPDRKIQTVENVSLSSENKALHMKVNVPRDHGEINQFRLIVRLHSIEGAGGAHEMDIQNPQTKHDCIVVACGQKYYLQSVVLAMNSRYFDRLFQDNPLQTNDDEIVLDCGRITSHFQFTSFIRLLYPSSAKIDYYSIDNMLYLADRFEMPQLVRRCSDFIMDDEDMTIFYKLQLAVQYKLIEAQNWVLKKLRAMDVADLKATAEEPTYDELLPESKRLLENIL